MKKQILLVVATSAVLLVTACSHKKEDKKSREIARTDRAYSTPVTEEGLMRTTRTWPESSQAAIHSLKGKYGLPSAVTEDMVVWNTSAPFKRSIVYKEEINHQFPIQHSDVLVQTVDYRVPLDKVSHLAKFDGSLIIDRTKGELSSRNDKEEMNILALNLADKIVKGDLSVEQARREYSKNAEAIVAGGSSALVTELRFRNMKNTTDPDSMMQSQTEDHPKVRKTIEEKSVEEIIEE